MFNLLLTAGDITHCTSMPTAADCVTAYHHTISGEIFTGTVIGILALIVLALYYRNFVMGKPTGGELPHDSATT